MLAVVCLGFLTGVLQAHARQTKTAIDTLVFRTSVLPTDETQITTAPATGACKFSCPIMFFAEELTFARLDIYGLFLEGARWDRTAGCVAESMPGELFAAMPAIWLQPQVNSIPLASDAYTCPLYKTSTRAGTLSTTGHSTNYVVSLHLTSQQASDHWIRRGVALLCQPDS